MTIIQPSDAVSARVLARKALEFHGPLYVRLPFDAVEDINDEATYHVEIGKANWVKRRGKDVTLIATGIMLDRTVKAAKALEARGVNAQIMEIHTLKPIDREAVITAAGETGAIVTVEDHSVIGGLGGAVAEVLATNLPVSMRMIGIQDWERPWQANYKNVDFNFLRQCVVRIVARRQNAWESRSWRLPEKLRSERTAFC